MKQSRNVPFTAIALLLTFSFVPSSLSIGCPDVTATTNTTNTYRKLHQVAPLLWDPKVASDCTNYAKKLAVGGCGLEHSHGPYGENLFAVTSYPKPDSTCAVAVKAWYSEVSRYNFKSTKPFTENWSKGVGHFTQLVWKSTTKFGCGVYMVDKKLRSMTATCKVIVCRYLPAGNVASDSFFKQNVLPPKVKSG
jgi:uncharacterized protein YkwD